MSGKWQQLLDEIEDSLNDPQVYDNEKRLAQALEKQQALLAEYQSFGGDQYPQRCARCCAVWG